MNGISELDRAGLRRFGLTTGAIVAALFGAALPWLFGADYPLWPWLVGGVLITWGAVAPASLRPVYRIWMGFGEILHRIMTPLVLSAIFYLVITPAGVLMRTLGRRGMSRDSDAASSSYRVSSVKPDVKNLEKPF